jgi:hypothetical protein
MGRGVRLRAINQAGKLAYGNASLRISVENNLGGSELASPVNNVSNNNNSPIVFSQPQKRKSPIQFNPGNQYDSGVFRSEDQFADFDERMEIQDTEVRLSKKAVLVNETNNTYHNYSNYSLSSILSNESTNHQSGQRPVTNVISAHLKKYGSQNKNRLLSSVPMPSLRAVFECKFENLNFPIGVRACNKRDWLIVCESGANLVKIYNRTTAKLLHTIGSRPNEFEFRRPSAVLINYETEDEMFIKDDNEIFVFDMDRFRLIRRFGKKLFKKPCKKFCFNRLN